MDLGYLKIRIDIKSEYDEYRKKYDYKKRETKKEEIKNMYEGFKEFFKNDGHFKFRENDHSLTAEYKEHGVTLDIDQYKNTDNPDFLIEGIITSYDRQVYEILAKGISNKDLVLQPAGNDVQEQMISDTQYFKDFIEGKINYTFVYNIKGREQNFASMQELMHAL